MMMVIHRVVMDALLLVHLKLDGLVLQLKDLIHNVTQSAIQQEIQSKIHLATKDIGSQDHTSVMQELYLELNLDVLQLVCLMMAMLVQKQQLTL